MYVCMLGYPPTPPFPPGTPEADRLTRLPHLRIRPRTATKGGGGGSMPSPPRQSKCIPSLYLHTILHMPFSMLLHTLPCMPDTSKPRNKSLWDHVMQRILATGICVQNVRSARKLFAAVCGRSVTNRTPLHLSLRAAANINTHTYTLAHTRATTTITQAFLHTPAHALIRIAGSLTQKQEMIGDVQCRESWQQESACKM